MTPSPSGPPLELGGGASPAAASHPDFGPARGINADLLFAENITDPALRFQRLETVVADMRREMDAIIAASLPPAPAEPVLAPTATLSDVDQMDAGAPGVPPASTPDISATQAAMPEIKAIRTGEHPGNVNRIVLDLTAASSYTADLDNEEHLLVLEIPGANWAATSKGTFKKMPLLTSWSTEPLDNNQGTRLVIQLASSVEIASKSVMKNPDRIVLDLKKTP
jgi:hypothetical protein